MEKRNIWILVLIGIIALVLVVTQFDLLPFLAIADVTTSEDTWVEAYKPNNNYGSKIDAIVDSWLSCDPGERIDAFIKFTIPSNIINDLKKGEIEITNVQVSLYGQGTRDYNADVTFREVSNTWSENTLTWNNMQVTTGQVLSTLRVSSTKQYYTWGGQKYAEYLIKRVVNENQNQISFRLVETRCPAGGNGADFTFYTKDYWKPEMYPKLIISTSPWCEQDAEKCIGTFLHICDNKQWINQGEVTGKCGITCEERDIIFVEDEYYLCVGGVYKEIWTVIELNYEEQQELWRMINELNVSIEEKNRIIQDLTATLEEQLYTIGQLNLSVSEKGQMIADLELNLQQQIDYIKELELNIQDKYLFIKELELEIEEQSQMIIDLTENLQEKTELLKLLRVENEEQAELLKAMELSFEEQAEILNLLNKTIQDDAEIIKNLNLSFENQANLIHLLNRTIEEDAELIKGLRLTIAEQVELIKDLKLTLEEEGKLIANLKLSLEGERALVIKLRETVEDQLKLIEEIEEQKKILQEKLAQQRKEWIMEMLPFILIGIVIFIILLFVIIRRRK